MAMTMTRAAVSAVLATILLGGCAVLPTAIDEGEVASIAADRVGRVDAAQEPISGPVDLYEAMARALKYNLDHQVEVYQHALRLEELDLAHYNMLPNVVANSGYAERDNDEASSSYNVLTQTQNFGASTSREKAYETSDISFSWHVLDFGLSLVRARQAADKTLIAEEMRRKAAHRIIEDVRTAFWRTVSADRLVSRLEALEGRARAAIANSRSVADSGETSPITALTYERELVEIKRVLQALRRELSVARAQLAALMNVKPGTRFALAIPRSQPKAPAFEMPPAEMIGIALRQRPELRENLYELRINEHERDAALLELLPGIQLVAGANYDSNDFLLNKHWLSWGAKASWNLIKAFQLPQRRQVIDAQAALLEERGLALTMAVMTQVHVSRAMYWHRKRELDTAIEYHDVQRRLVEQIRAEANADRVSEQTLIREELNALVAEAKRDIAFADAQNAYANIFASMGLDPHVDGVEQALAVKDLAQALRQLWFERGDYAGRVRVAHAGN